MIRRELSVRRYAVFKDRDRQDAFLTRIEGALTYLRTRESARPDPHRSQERIGALHKALVEAERALNLMEQPERAAIEHGRSGQLVAFGQDVAQMREQAESAADAFVMRRGPQDRDRNPARLLVQQMAEGWFFVFERKPSAKDDGAFFKVANIVLGQIGEPEMKKDALRTILKGAGF
ncbi:MAG: hypothetical protein H5U15_07580 [Roseovarius sp.]|nr:hypothetical protein [Roseovarius sp.]